MKPSQIINPDEEIEYGVPFEHTDPTYVMAGKISMSYDDPDWDAVLNKAADVVEEYAKLGYFGGFIRTENTPGDPDILCNYEVWITSINDPS